MVRGLEVSTLTMESVVHGPVLLPTDSTTHHQRGFRRVSGKQGREKVFLPSRRGVPGCFPEYLIVVRVQ